MYRVLLHAMHGRLGTARACDPHCHLWALRRERHGAVPRPQPHPQQQQQQQQQQLRSTHGHALHQQNVTSMHAAAAAAARGSSQPASCCAPTKRGWLVVAAAGLPFALSRPQQRLKFKWARRVPGYSIADLQVEVDALQEGQPAGMSARQVAALLAQLEQDAALAVPLALAAKQEAQPGYRLPAIANLSLVLCDDAHIQALNRQHRGMDAPTDVLSFELPDESPALQLPVKLLGDLVVSLDTAARQAQERGHPLLTELRVLLVHGLLHLVGFDHERGPTDAQQMAAREAALLQELGWEGQGLISLAGAAGGDDDDDGAGDAGSSGTGSEHSNDASSSSGGSSEPAAGSPSSSSSDISSSSSSSSSSSMRRSRLPQVPLVALDMDGTLLDSSSNISPGSAAAIRAALSAGVQVILATGKARPAAIAACRKAQLEGNHLLVSARRPGVFLQGLAVHGHQGQQLSDAALPAEVVSQAFTWSAAAGVSCVAFLGDECATLQLTDDLRELHTRYYEPLAHECSSVEELLRGPAVRKLLFMAPPDVVDGLLKPHWGGALQGHAAELLQAVPNMLEVVPAGVNKWAGLQVLLEHMSLAPAQLMAVGDGSNDLEMVRHAGIGVAMHNAVPAVKAVADVVVASNDDGGIAEAFERFVL